MPTLDYCNVLLVGRLLLHCMTFRLPRTTVPGSPLDWACMTTSCQPRTDSTGWLSTTVYQPQGAERPAEDPQHRGCTSIRSRLGGQACNGEDPVSERHSAAPCTMHKLISYHRPRFFGGCPKLLETPARICKEIFHLLLLRGDLNPSLQ